MAKLLELPRLGKYGKLAEKHLKEHLPKVYQELKQSGQLLSYLLDVEERTDEAVDQVRASLKKSKPLPKETTNFLEVLAYQNWLQRTSEELVLQEFILLPDEETAKAMREGGYTD